MSVEYNYNALNLLQHDLDDLHNFSKNIVICAYRVKEGLNPYLEFLLCKNSFNMLNFPCFPSPYWEDGDIKSGISIELECEIFLKMLLDDMYSVADFRFKGFLQDEHNIFMFYDLTYCNIELYDNETNVWFGLIDEIINRKHICNYRIINFVRDFFLIYNDFAYLQKVGNEETYETPVVLYSGQADVKLRFTYVFGVVKKEKIEKPLLGPYYYLTNYDNSVLDAKSQRRNTCGVVRLAVFLGDYKVIENNLNDPTDTSLIKENSLRLDDYDNENQACDVLNEILMMRISDYDGNWSNNYDSIILPNITLDNGTKLGEKIKPVWVIKSYNQQYPLSYHVI